MNVKYLSLAGLLGLLLAIALSSNDTAAQMAIIEDLWFTADDFAAGSGTGYAITAGGLTIAGAEVTAIYTSPVIEAPIRFNAIVPQWTADIPGTASMEITLRTKTAAGAWSQWYDVHEQPDWMLPEDSDTVGGMVAVPAADVTHQQTQFSVSFGRSQDAAAPTLNQLRLTFIDSTAGPTGEEMLAQQMALDALEPNGGANLTQSYPRPTVISREVWCIYDDCNYTTGMEYEPVTHLVVHHTVSDNNSSDWAAVVRAIWNFHTYSRGWGDIGYNYLVDMDGLIYEGHNSEDYENLDVIGIHASAANAGGLGTALIGTFTTPEEYPVSGTPPQPMLDAAADLFAWKADQRDIDVYDASRMVNTSWGLPHLMGHRDVYGGTATLCPGGNAHALLPWLRDEVAQLLNYASPYIYVDELSSDFTKSNNNWYEGPRGCGNNGHSYYTWSTTDPGESSNWGEWRPQIPEDGRYEIEVYAPYCDTGAAETDGATYQITHAAGVSTTIVSHNDDVGLWMSLGEFNLLAGSSTVIRLTDLTATDTGLGVWFDAIRLQKAPTAVTNVSPTANAWLNQPGVTFTWSITNPTNIQTTTLAVATDVALTNKVMTATWPAAAISRTHTFSQEYASLYWQVTLVQTSTLTTTNTIITSPLTSFGLDMTPPTSTLTTIYQMPDDSYLIYWQGNDALSGIAGYDVEYRVEGAPAWTGWLTNTTAATGTFTPPDPAQVYQFRIQAVDLAGNTESPHAAADLSTDQAIPLPYAIMLPVVTR